MALRIYNTYSRQLTAFVPENPPVVTYYSCGPTVYSTPTIGNYRSYVLTDILKRTLEYLGYTVKHVMNITDVGHLVDDADAGEDKMQKAAEKEKKDPIEIANYYADIFLTDLKNLHCLPAEVYPRATEYIPQMIELIKVLIDKGYAYETADGIYYDVSRFPRYGQLSGNKPEDLLAGARIEVNEQKRSPIDFALWKKLVGENEHHRMRWNSPWGEGFPGWHIECSAMSMSLLGKTIDLHTGGEDNLFPHHECEIAQSEAANDAPFVRYWMHWRHLLVNGQRMGKSLGNAYTMAQMTEMGYSPRQVRYLYYTAHYRTKMNFTLEGLVEAGKNLAKIDAFVQRCQADYPQGDLTKDWQEYRQQFTAALEDDLNTPLALATLFDLIREGNKRFDSGLVSANEAQTLLTILHDWNQVLGFLEFSFSQQLKPEIEQLMAARTAARAAKNWAEADRLRDQLTALGYQVQDKA